MDLNNLPKKQQDNNRISKRATSLFFLVFVSFSLLIGRLATVQIAEGKQYSQEENQNLVKAIPTEAIRGDIVDRNGVSIASSRLSYAATFDEEDWMTPDYMLQLAKRLVPVLNIPLKDIVSRMDFGYDENGKFVGRHTPKFMHKDLKVGLSLQEVGRLEENRERLYRGINVATKSIRVYDPKQIAVQTVGYVRPFAIAVNSPNSTYKKDDPSYLPEQPVGMDGIENSFENYLKGSNGEKRILTNANNNQIRVIDDTPPTKGDNVYLTIDSRVQQDAKQYVQSYLTELRRQNPKTALIRNAYAVAIEVQTGRIVAMLSYPEYDPNIWVTGLDDASWSKIQYAYINGTIRPAPYDASLDPNQNGKHPDSLIPSGSVIKPSTVMMALSEHLITPYDQWQDEPNFRYGSASDVVHNWSHRDFGILTPQKALKLSSNTYMSHLGMLLVQNNKSPVGTFQRYQHDFGLGIPTKVDLPFESSGTEDYIETSKKISTVAAIVQASFGQQEHYTTLQLANYAATIANRGKRMRPLIVDKVVSPENKVVKQFKPEVLSNTHFDDAYWNVVYEGMREVVEEQGGTARGQFLGTPYRVDAKTGTSQQDIYVQKSNGKWGLYSQIENSSFIGFAPADHPKLAVAVVVPEGGYSTESANFIARAIFDSYNKYYGL